MEKRYVHGLHEKSCFFSIGIVDLRRFAVVFCCIDLLDSL